MFGGASLFYPFGGEMARVIVFDVNETLLDLHALEPQFTDVFGDARVLEEWFANVLLRGPARTVRTRSGHR